MIASGPCLVPSSGWGPHTEAYGYKLGAELMGRLHAPSLRQLRELVPQQLQWDNSTLGSDNFAGYFYDGVGATGMRMRIAACAGACARMRGATVGVHACSRHARAHMRASRPNCPRPPLRLPVLDTWPAEAYKAGRTVTDALVVGHTSKDGTSGFYGTAPLANATSSQWAEAMTRRWGRHARAVMARYSLERFGNGSVPAVSASYIEADADERVACPTRRLATLAAEAAVRRARALHTAPLVPRGSAPLSHHLGGEVYAFVFSHLHLSCDAAFENRNLPWWEPLAKRAALASSGWASHGSDVKFYFGTTLGQDSLALPPFPQKPCPFTQPEANLSAQTREWVSEFVAHGAPSLGGGVAWPPFRAASGGGASRTMELEALDEPLGLHGSRLVHAFKAADCQFWEALEPPPPPPP